LYAKREGEKLSHLPGILGAAATGFLLKDVLKEACDPFTGLLGRLNLLRCKLGLETKDLQEANGHGSACYQEIVKVERLVEDLSKTFKYMLENTFCLEPAKISQFDVNRSLLRAITILRLYDGLDGDSIKFETQSELPMMASNEQDFVMIFLIFLLLSRDCLTNVSNRTIKCETITDNSHIVASISHNGSIRQDRCLDIIFHDNPIEGCFFNSGLISYMDTLLYYSNLLMKKHGIRIRIRNIPGQFSLSLFIPTIRRSDLTGKP
jgi:hypothetical protein